MFKDWCNHYYVTYPMRSILVLISICYLAGCVGPRVPAYETKPQKFSWGQAHVWMSDATGTRRDAKMGVGYLLVDMVYKRSYLNKNCTITLNHVSMNDPDSGAYILDEIPLSSDNSLMTRKIGDYRSGQFGLWELTFNFDRDSFPHDVNLNMSLNCPNEKTEHNFSQEIRFRMVQPVMWEQ
jgi:hypothetical protein